LRAAAVHVSVFMRFFASRPSHVWMLEMTFRIGLVGVGRMGTAHLRAVALSEVVRVVAVAEPAPERRDHLAGPEIAVHADLGSMLRAGGLDGVVVAAPSAFHLELVTQAVDAGVPVLCEKPGGLTMQQIGSAADAAKKRGVPLQVGYWRRFVPALQHLRQRMIAGELGDIYLVVCHQWDAAPPPLGFRASSGGIFIDMGVHEFDQVRWLSGQEIARLEPAVSTIAADLPVANDAESAQVLCTMSEGAVAFVALGRRFRLGDVCSVQIFGTRDAEECRFRWPPESDATFLLALRSQAEAFAAWVRGGVAAGASAADAVAALR
jgi:myo-inositol 2-dehydrogenase / D-chiro-inositol 1-dehydrogenase